MGGGDSSAPAPDPQIGRAALKQAKLSKEWLDVAKEQFAAANARDAKMAGLTEEVARDQMGASREARQWAAEDRSRYRSVFQPLQDEFVQKARGWDSPERQRKMAEEARADVLNEAALARDANRRQLASMGVNPDSGRFQGIERATDMRATLAGAGAANKARDTVRTQGMALTGDAINMGAGLPSQAAGSLGLGVNAGSSAAGTSINANQAQLLKTGMLNQAYAGAIGGFGSAAGTLNQQYGNQLNAWAQNQANSAANTQGIMSGIGTIAGIAGMAMLSSKKAKEAKKPARGALKAVRDMPVEEWTYKDGMGDGGRHIGPYAEDFQRVTGKGDGRTIGVIDAIGLNMKATQELADKVDRLAARRTA